MECVNSPQVLSIQSHVVHGYVGNRSAVFPLQLLGFEVDFINSVQLCSHTMYKYYNGQILNEKDLRDLFDGIKGNGLDSYNYLLTGYVGAPSFLLEIISVYKHLKNVNKNLIYVCDPVLGDNGSLYVPEELVAIYRDQIIPYVDILTPNQFELELLSETKISNIDDIWTAIENIHIKGCKTVVVSSSELSQKDTLLACASTKYDGSCKRVTIKIPKKAAFFVGTGDIFAALFMGWMYKSNNNLKLSLEKTVASLQAILERTLLYAKGKELTPKNLELKIIQSKKDIEEPNIAISAECITKNCKNCLH